ncbi:GntR family transcriptional regulator [Victivallis vadensis]|uniref:GntR family transcriptional regulator n=1 Tax=Victivallis vadensis TaxID=172901 RepID=UPI0023F738EB|nr:GntR family transcriptional regulator [Victivallis vadensis]
MENQMRKPEISEQLINYLEERLLAGEYRPGMRIPSVRRLAAKFCLSYGSAIRGIDFLCEQGKLEKASKRGIYVCRQETPLLIGGGPAAGRSCSSSAPNWMRIAKACGIRHCSDSARARRNAGIAS